MFFSPWRRWLTHRSRLATAASRKKARGRLRSQPRVEALEDRVVPTLLHVWTGAVSANWSDNGNWVAFDETTGQQLMTNTAPNEANADIGFTGDVKPLTKQTIDNIGMPIHSIFFDDAGFTIQSPVGTNPVVQLTGNIVSDSDPMSIPAGIGPGNTIMMNLALSGGTTHHLYADVANGQNGQVVDQLVLTGTISGSAQDPIDVNGAVDVTPFVQMFGTITFPAVTLLNFSVEGEFSPNGAGPEVPMGTTTFPAGQGDVVFAGTVPNTYLGATTVDAGTLVLNDSGGNAVPGSLIIGNSMDAPGSAVVQLKSNEQIANNAAVTVNPSGKLDLNNFAETIGPLTMTAGSVTTGSGRLTLTGDVTVNAAGTPATISGSGTLDLGASNRTFTLAAGGELDISTLIDGSAGLTETGGGKLVFQGTSPNIYLGTTTVNAGTLVLDDAGGNAVPGPLTIGNSMDAPGSAVVQLKSNEQIANNAAVTVNPSGKLDLNNFAETIGPLTMTAGSVTTGSGRLTLTGDVTVNAAGTPATISGSGTLDLGASNRTFTLAAGAELDISTVIAGLAGLTETGGGKLVFLGASPNVYLGITTLNAGTLDLAKTSGTVAVPGDLVIGAGATVNDDQNEQIANSASVTVNRGTLNLLANLSETIGALALNGGSVTTGASSTLSAGPLTLNGGTITTGTGSQVVLNGDVTATLSPAIGGSGTLSLGGSTRTFTVSSGSDTLTVSIPIAGSAGLTKAGAGTLAIDASNTYSGTTTVNGGLLQVNAPETLAGLAINGASVATAAGIHLTLNGDVTATLNSTIGGSGTLALGNSTRTFTVSSGSDTLTVSIPITGSAGLTEAGAGTLTLGAPNTYTGTTTVNGGLLQVNAPQTLAGLSINGGSVSTGAGITVTLNGPVTATLNSTIAGSGILNLGSSTRTFTTTGGAELDVGIPIAGSGSAGVTKSGDGTLKFQATLANSYPGTTTVLSGGTATVNPSTLVLATPAGLLAVPGDLVIGDNSSPPGTAVVSLRADDQIAHTAAVTINSSGLLQLNGHMGKFGSLSVSGTIDLGGGTLTVASLSGSGTIDLGGGTLIVNSGNISTFSGVINGPGTLIKTGVGTLQIGGSGTSSGQIVVSGGEVLILNNTSQPNVFVTVQSGGTLGGTGTVGPTEVLAGGTLAPGTDSALGVLAFKGDLKLDAGSRLVLRLNSDAQAGQTYDQIRVTGQLTLGDPTGGNPVLDLVLGPNFSATPSSAIGKPTFTLIQTTGGPVQGRFALRGGPALPGGSLFVHGSPPSRVVLELAYHDDAGNNVGLTSLNDTQLFIRSLLGDFHVSLDQQLDEQQRNTLALLPSETAIAETFLSSKQNRTATLNTFYQRLGLPLPLPTDRTYNRYLGQLLTGGSKAGGTVFGELVTSKQFTRMHRRNGNLLKFLIAGVPGSPTVTGLLGSLRAIPKTQRAQLLQGLNQGTLSRAMVVEQLLSSDTIFIEAIKENFATFLNNDTPSLTSDIDPILALLKQGQFAAPDDLSLYFLTGPLGGKHIDAFLKRCMNPPPGRTPEVVCAMI